ncbi:J domain-containing protein [Lacipirellula parvula]|uniref:J domain-containing protein n=1 Tax=Lacipirellula parvula TaxID=2650471 RepID=A0A5K7X526_9BACT|nr:J domain-containing protein [Lacipirellula parvula]BBO30907.1 hypothetical protein PLANPX_0519 [Lacipirellula parvula]
MSDENAQVDWSLLPHQPLKFFGLAPTFDRKDLKRAYNRLLRQFKPEKHPNEFQQIRAAYELLDNQQRYGAAATAPPEYKWQTDDGAAKPATAAERSAASQQPVESAAGGAPELPATPAPLPLHQRIRHEPLANVYRQLAEKQHKLPYDYYALAVMSDAVDRKDGQQFLRWLLQGLAEHRCDRALLNLLYEYLRGPLAIETVAKILVAVSKTVRTDEFFPLTESLWHRLLRERPFAEFRKTFEVCEANLRDIRIDARLAFTIEILKSAIWVADPAWIAQAFGLIEENFQRIPPQVQNDLDLLDFLRNYVAGRPDLATAHPLRRRIDEALREFFSGDAAKRDRTVLQCQVEMAADPLAALAAFPLKADEDYSNFYTLWCYVSADVAERHVVERKPANVSAWISRGRAIYEGIEQRLMRSKIYARWTMMSTLYRIAVGTVYFVAACIAGLLTLPMLGSGFFWDMIMPWLAIGGAICLCLFIQFRYVRPKWKAYEQTQLTRLYAEVSREELAGFLQRSQFSHQELRDLLFNADITNLNYAQSTADHFQQDYALAIYAMALRFQV